MKQGHVYWITGLSGSGKTTLCRGLVDNMRAKGRAVLMLDGDILRNIFGAANDAHTKEERLSLSLQYAQLAKNIAEQGIDAAVATISMHNDIYQWNRENLANYTEIFIDVPIEELKKRDPKGIYRKAEAGEIQNVAGLDMKIDIPNASHIHLRWAPGLTSDKMLSYITTYLEKKC